MRGSFRGGFTRELLPTAAGTIGPDVEGVLVDGGAVWFGCGTEVCRLEKKAVEVFGAEAGLPEAQITTLRKDGEGNLWVYARKQGVFELPAGQSRFIRPNTPEDPRTLRQMIAVDREGRVLIPGASGLLIHEKNGWHVVGAANGLRGETYCAFEDRSHALWVGLVGRGVVRWNGYHEWEEYSAGSGLASDMVYEILPERNGLVWAGTSRGLSRGVEGEFGVRWQKVEAVGTFSVHSVLRGPDGWLWLGSEEKGIGRYSPASGRMEWLELGKTNGITGALALHFDDKGRLWAGTDVGLFVASAPYRRFTKIDEAGSKRIWAVAEGSDGRIWAGGSGGLFARDGDGWKKFGKADGLSNDAVLSLGAAPEGMVWVGYEFGGGIDRVRLEGGRLRIEKGVQRPGTDG